ncbi:nuclear transport factor 2 family protein [Microbulbifer sp. YPW1]|uniref:nuclear transport factor 2 family protein n=1 Tax=Microbulbifer sp. YPW1 TaxID=2745199 RepID=UPI00159A60E9|nr:nuclear transport factor 2 family protein [Microbulbifer sp. YPW1]QKX15722.1 nuclear transport factor 2 family protein [Microbulbifer sp. YPW1]
MLKSLWFPLLLALLTGTANAETNDHAELKTLLDQFLAGAASDIQVHQRFWAEDLIYTSSSGQRFGKQKIIQGMRSAKSEAKDGEKAESNSIRYRAEDTDIRLFDETAIVAFRLIAESKPADGNAGSSTPESEYFNTGTFIKRDGQWRAVAWQATKIPASPTP